MELMVDGVSWGVKAYEFPNQGMTQYWGHFDRPFAPVTTNDLHLSWDIPYTQGEIVAIGRDAYGKEIARKVLRPAGAPAALEVTLDREALAADGRDVVQAEIRLMDAQGNVVPHCDLPVSLAVDGGDLLGMDNGNIRDHELYRSGTRTTYGGLAYAIVRAPRAEGMMTLTFSAPGLEPVRMTIPCK
jgi:beta-galactosidase